MSSVGAKTKPNAIRNIEVGLPNKLVRAAGKEAGITESLQNTFGKDVCNAVSMLLNAGYAGAVQRIILAKDTDDVLVFIGIEQKLSGVQQDAIRDDIKIKTLVAMKMVTKIYQHHLPE